MRASRRKCGSERHSVGRSSSAPWSNRPEGRPDFFGEDLRLLPGGEVAAFVDFVEVDELWIRLLRPAPWSWIELVGEDGHADWDLDALDVEEGQMALPVEAGRGDGSVREPVVRDVVEDVVSRKATGLPGKSARHELVAALVVVEHPGRQADRRVRDAVERLRAVGHLAGVAHAGCE